MLTAWDRSSVLDLHLTVGGPYNFRHLWQLTCTQQDVECTLHHRIKQVRLDTANSRPQQLLHDLPAALYFAQCHLWGFFELKRIAVERLHDGVLQVFNSFA